MGRTGKWWRGQKNSVAVFCCCLLLRGQKEENDGREKEESKEQVTGKKQAVVRRRGLCALGSWDVGSDPSRDTSPHSLRSDVQEKQ